MDDNMFLRHSFVLSFGAVAVDLHDQWFHWYVQDMRMHKLAARTSVLL